MRFGLRTLFWLTLLAAVATWLLAGVRSPFVWIVAASLPVAAGSMIAGRAAHWLLERESAAVQQVGAAILLAALLTLAASAGTALAGLVGFAASRPAITVPKQPNDC